MGSVILLTIFITNSISVNKRKIGILRALGTKTSDILKIFILESNLVGILTFVLSGIGTIAIIEIVNNYITKELFFYVRPVIFEINGVISIIVVILIVIIISLVIPIIKLSKSKPIDLIRKD